MIMNLEELGTELVKCSLDCDGITNNPAKGIIPRCLIFEKKNGKNQIVVVGLNPGRCKEKEKQYYLEKGVSYQSLQAYFFGSNLHERPYFKRTRDLVSLLGFHGDILWTDLVKCECSGKRGVLPVQTLRVCISGFLKREIDLFGAEVIFTLGNQAFNFCSLSFPGRFVVGLPHPTGSYGDFFRLRHKIEDNLQFYKGELEKRIDKNQNIRAIHLSRLSISLNLS